MRNWRQNLLFRNQSVLLIKMKGRIWEVPASKKEYSGVLNYKPKQAKRSYNKMISSPPPKRRKPPIKSPTNSNLNHPQFLLRRSQKRHSSTSSTTSLLSSWRITMKYCLQWSKIIKKQGRASYTKEILPITMYRKQWRQSPSSTHKRLRRTSDPLSHSNTLKNQQPTWR